MSRLESSSSFHQVLSRMGKDNVFRGPLTHNLARTGMSPQVRGPVAPQSRSLENTSKIMTVRLNSTEPHNRNNQNQSNLHDELLWLENPVEDSELLSRIKRLREAKRKWIQPAAVPCFPRFIPGDHKYKAEELASVSERLSRPKPHRNRSYKARIVSKRRARSFDEMNQSACRLSVPRTFESKFSRYISGSCPSLDAAGLFSGHSTENLDHPREVVLEASRPNLSAYRQAISSKLSHRFPTRIIGNPWKSELAENIKAICHRICILAEKAANTSHPNVPRMASNLIQTNILFPNRNDRASMKARNYQQSFFPELSECIKRVLSLRPSRLILLRLCQVASSLKRT
jgi:hypothetical protein